MLAIQLNNGRWINWWIGMAIPKIVESERVVTFQADGDELSLFFDAMTASAGSHPKVNFTETDGFQPKPEELPEVTYGGYSQGQGPSLT